MTTFISTVNGPIPFSNTCPSTTKLPYPLRLPAYRSSYLGRFHPYGRRRAYGDRDCEVDLMQTVDLRYSGGGTTGDAGRRPSVSLVNLHCGTADGAAHEGSQSVVEEDDEEEDALLVESDVVTDPSEDSQATAAAATHDSDVQQAPDKDGQLVSTRAQKSLMKHVDLVNWLMEVVVFDGGGKTGLARIVLPYAVL
ncbi:hypothetical protein PHLCEN_2v3817 [Hermanssonia centrifuga]|uniref:Uncharacterized protein n=1 Tax=Hermanssonia centrifuga TaxID=98765 RepID=A0A2R6QBD7_9APHY|nr:hypothetical protein PHLCEN_2v3817 [Hermanssonia centrifuga]